MRFALEWAKVIIPSRPQAHLHGRACAHGRLLVRQPARRSRRYASRVRGRRSPWLANHWATASPCALAPRLPPAGSGHHRLMLLLDSAARRSGSSLPTSSLSRATRRASTSPGSAGEYNMVDCATYLYSIEDPVILPGKAAHGVACYLGLEHADDARSVTRGPALLLIRLRVDTCASSSAAFARAVRAS